MNTLAITLIAPAATIAYIFILWILMSYMRQRRHRHSTKISTLGLRTSFVQTSFVRIFIGLFLVVLGAFLFQKDGLFAALGTYALILGYQIVFWAVGIESEYLGTVPTHNK